MELILKVTDAILPVFLLLGLGWFMRRVGLLTEELVSGLNRVAFVVVFPVLLFQKIGSKPFGEVFNGALLVGTCACVVFVWLMSYFLVKLKKDIKPARQGVIVQGAFRPNTAVIGLAILAGAFGEVVFGPGGMLLSAMVPLMNVLSVMVLVLPHRQGRDAKSLGKTALLVVTNPLIIGAIAGAIRSMLALKLPRPLDNSFEMLSDMAIPVALLGGGGSLKLHKLKGDMAASVFASVIKLLFMPLLTWIVLAGIFHLSGMLLAIGVIYSAAPTAIASFIMAEQMKGDADLAASILVMTHLVSILTLSAWLAALLHYG